MADAGSRRMLRPGRRGAVLIALVSVVVLLAALAALLTSAFGEVRDTTSRFTERALTITDLANVQRELLGLSRDIARFDGTGEAADAVELRLGLLRTHWTSTTDDVAEMPAQADSVAEVRALDTRLIAATEAVEEALGAPDAVDRLAALQPRLDALDAQVKSIYAVEEIAYHGVLGAALESRSSASAMILATLVLLVGAGIVLGVVIHRVTRESVGDARDQLRSVERRFEELFAEVREAIVTLDDDGRLTLVNPGWERMVGASESQSLGRPLTAFVDVPDGDDGWTRDADDQGEVIAQAALRGDGGTARWAEVSRRRRTEGGWVVTLVDVTARVAATRELTRQARQDAMTGLANRAHLVARLGSAIDAQHARGAQTGVVFLDLDRFKLVNDHLGHDFGDQLLREVGIRLRATIRGDDLACRLGGDEFVILCAKLPDDRDAAQRTVQGVADRVLAVLAAPMSIGGREVRVRASAGIALSREGQRPDSLLAEADAAMYHAKDMGRGRIEVFDAALKARIDDRVVTEQALRDVVRRGELEVWMQPMHDLRSGVLGGFEALLRWRHPQWGLLEPERFLHIAEEIGEIEHIGSWVLEEACRRAVSWDRVGPEGLRVAVNVSAVQFAGGDLPLRVAEALRGAGLDPSRLEIEITESVYLGADERVLRQLHALEALGVTIAMDDFGTGYSSLAALRDLPVDVVKLDRSFVSGIGTRQIDEAIITSTIAMAQATGLQIVAEGIERVDQLELLRSLGCDRGQGFLFSRPVEPGVERDVILRGIVGSLTGP